MTQTQIRVLVESLRERRKTNNELERGVKIETLRDGKLYAFYINLGF